MSKIITYFCTLFCLSFIFSLQVFPADDAAVSGDMSEKTVVFLCEGKNEYTENLVRMLKNEIKKKSGRLFKPCFKEPVFCGWDRDIISGELDKLMNGRRTDLIIGIGAYVCLAVSEKDDLTVPVILAGVYDAEIFGLPEKNGTSGKRNLTYFSGNDIVRKEIEAFQAISPFKTLYVLLDSSRENISRRLKRNFLAAGIAVEFIEYDDNIDALVKELSAAGAEAVYLSRAKDISDEKYEELISLINKQKIPTFSTLGMIDVRRDVLAGIAPRSLSLLAGRAARDTVKIFEGVDAGTLPVKYESQPVLIINAAVARETGINLPFDILLDSRIVYTGEKTFENKISIYRAVEEARNNNLLFRIKEQEIEKAENLNLSYWSVFLPQVDYYMDYDIRDTETAKKKGYPKYFYSHGMSLSQMIFSDPAIRDIMNSKKEVEIKRLEKYSATLDITAETSGAYLNYLKAKSFLGVEEENLEDLRANHTIAEQRNSKGIGTEDELLRWQSEISKAESDVIESGTVVAMARVILNQLMNRPQNSSLAEEDVGLEMARYYVGTKYMNPFIGNFNTLEKFAEFMVDEGIMNSPEMKTLEITIKQQKQAKNTAARKFFLPEAYLTGDLKKKLEKKYIDGGTHEDDHADWTVGLKLSYPLFEGGNKVFDLDRQKAELERLFFKRELAAQNIELEVRKACYLMYHSYQNISLSHSSMLDASENLAMITDKYAEGKASVTDMIVAQQDKITKERDAVTAVYDFLLNLVNFDRAVSNFYFLALPEERKKWLNGLYKYLSEI